MAASGNYTTPTRAGIFTPTSSVAGYDSVSPPFESDEDELLTPQSRRYRELQHQQNHRHQPPPPPEEYQNLENLVTKVLDERFRALDDRLSALIQRRIAEATPPTSSSSSNPANTPSTAIGTPAPAPPPAMSADVRKIAIERRLHQLHSTKAQIDASYARWLNMYDHELSQLHSDTWTPSSSIFTPSCPCECRSISTLLGPSLPRLDIAEDGNIENAVLQWCTRIDDRVAAWGEEIVCPLLCVPLAEERRLWRWYTGLRDNERRRYTEGQGCWGRFREAVIRRAGRVEKCDVGRVMERHVAGVLTVMFLLFLWGLWQIYDDVPVVPLGERVQENGREWPWPRV